MKTFSRLLIFVIPFWPQVLLSTLLGALTIGASIGLMATSALLISTAALHPSVSAVGLAVVGVRFFGISRGILRYLERLASHSVTFKILARLRVWFYQAIEPLAPARLVSSRSGDLLSRIISDVETLDNLFVRVLAPPLVAIIVILCMAGFMSAFSIILGMVLTAFLLGIGWGLASLSLSLNQKPGRNLTDQRALLRSDLVDAVQGLPDLIAFGQENKWQEKIILSGKRFSDIQKTMAGLSGFQSGLNIFLSGMGVWVILYISIPLVLNGEIQGIHLAVIILAAMASFEAVQTLPQAAQLLEANLQSARRLFEIADCSPAVKEPKQPMTKPTTANLYVHELKFAYESALVLDKVNFDLPEGKKMAIVGPSGAGKSTITNLLMRYWEYDGGQISLDGQDIRLYSTIESRKVFSLVSQGTYLFNTTLHENLRLARPMASKNEIEDACRRAGLNEFVSSLPRGLDTIVGERGVRFSGGERQRVAIARAILKDAPIYIFDEPTANLDPANERRLIETLLKVPSRKSVLWITHRLIGLEGMDEILVLDKGLIVERGTHAELLNQQGLYRKLWGLQYF